MDPEEEIDRAILWKKARRNKNGEVDDEVMEICSKIVSLYFYFFENINCI